MSRGGGDFYTWFENKGCIVLLQLHSVEGRGRCFIRVALCQKLISVPIEHLVRNAKLTQVGRYESSMEHVGEHVALGTCRGTCSAGNM